MRKFLGILLLSFLAACAGYGGNGLLVGQANYAQVVQTMGEPAMQWIEADGSQLLAYPRGPRGLDTFMVRLGSDGKLQRIENVLKPEFFQRVQPKMSHEEVLHILGPSPSRPSYFSARDELVWEWPYCDSWNARALFYVLFDGTSKQVRSTMSLTEDCGKNTCSCSHSAR